MALQDHYDFVNQTQTAYVNKYGWKMSNEVLGLSYIFAKLLDKTKLVLQGGKTASIDLLVDAEDMARWVGPMEVRQPRIGKHTARMEIGWGFLDGDWTIAEEEIALNDKASEREQINSLVDIREEAMKTGVANKLDASFWDSLGGWDKQSDDVKPMLGAKAWITRDGLTVDGNTTMLGVSSTRYPFAVNRYCGPLGSNLTSDFSADATDGITSANQLLDKMAKMITFLQPKAPTGVKFNNTPQGPTWADRMMIVADAIGFFAYQKLLQSLRDDIRSENVANPMPKYFGMDVEFCEKIGLGSAGIPAYAAHGSISAAAYPNTGEMFFINTTEMRVIGKDGYLPNKKPLELIALQCVFYQLYRWFLALGTRSRQRHGLIWGFAPLTLS